MAFAVASWNVEFFGSRRKGEAPNDVRGRIDRVSSYLKDNIDADVYAIYEVNGGSVFEAVTTEFPHYSWQITEGPGAQQILAGFRVPAFVTQRLEFRRGFAGDLRPGLLVTVREGVQNFPMLFLHLKSADRPIDFGVRAYQNGKARSLRKALDAVSAPQRANFIVAGDFNTLGMHLTFSARDLEISDEIARLNQLYSSPYDRMRLRPKTHGATFWNGPGSSDPPADLDHVIAAQRVRLAANGEGKEIEVLGWREEMSDQARGKWISEYSDHALLRFKVIGAN